MMEKKMAVVENMREGVRSVGRLKRLMGIKTQKHPALQQTGAYMSQTNRNIAVKRTDPQKSSRSGPRNFNSFTNEHQE